MPVVFVFGSNLRGRHGAGAALDAARLYGAAEGVAEGPTGQAYAIPTRDAKIRTLPLVYIQKAVNRFCTYATKHPNTVFRVTRIGCGHAGYTDEQIAPFFKLAPDNCRLPPGWRRLIDKAL
jgi:hypothetical protein